MNKYYHEDDRLIIPDDIKHMTKVELEAEIARLEKEDRERDKKSQIAAMAM